MVLPLIIGCMGVRAGVDRGVMDFLVQMMDPVRRGGGEEKEKCGGDGQTDRGALVIRKLGRALFRWC